MISGFVCDCHGFMAKDAIKSYEFFEAGTSRQGWYTNENLVNLFRSCSELFKDLHPDCDVMIAFDNSMTHHAKADDALDANRLNLSDGGKGIKHTRSGWFLKKNPLTGVEERVVQPMQREVGGVLTQKGVKTILQERHEFYGVGGHEPKLRCVPCKAGRFARDAAVADGFLHPRCCATYILSTQPDFMEQGEWLTEEVRQAGFSIIFYPKYHCEFNYIEQIWGWLKSYHRQHCKYNYKDLKDNLPLTISDKLSLSYVQKVYRSAFRFMTGYRLGMKGPLLDFAMKKYSGHRVIPSGLIAEINSQFDKWTQSKKRKI
jgi:hypothetical protein